MDDTSFVSLSLPKYNELYEKATRYRWRPISEYNPVKHDWVLIKCYDNEFECIPFVAERKDGKWYDRGDNEVIFEVRYFFDMQQII